MNTWLPLLVTLLIQAFSALSLVAVPVLVPVEGGVPRLSANGIGLYLFCSYVGAVLGSLGAGPIVARLGAIRTSQYALALSTLGLAMAAMWPGGILLAAFCIGLGYGPITPASSHVLIQTTPTHQRNLVFSIKQTGVPVGVAMTGFLIPPLGSSLGWAGTLLVLAGACAVVVVLANPIRAELDARTALPQHMGQPTALTVRFMMQQLFVPLTVIAQHRQLRILAAVSFVFSGIQIAFTSYIVSYLTSSLALSALLSGSLLALSQLGGVMGRITWGYLSDKWINPLHMLALLAGAISLSAFSTASLSHWGVVVPALLLSGLMVLYGASASGWNGVYLAEVARRAPAGQAAQATSGTLACTFFGVLVGAPLFGLVVSSPGGYTLAFAMQAVFALSIGILLFIHRAKFSDLKPDPV
ncbi:MAG: MFS transporter [Betaproteobacteria bacterium]|nr:MFS transporter [Betaproteobacteria bacterium]